MIAYASQRHYSDHLQPFDVAIVNRRPVNESHVLVASRRDARKLEPCKQTEVAVIEHGAGQRYHIDAGGPEVEHKNVTLFLAPSARVVRQSRHLFPNADCVVVGSARVEQLSKLERDPRDIALTFHWNSPVAPEAMSAWQHYQRTLPLLKHLPLIGHAHPAIASKLRHWYKRYDVEFVEDWADVVKRAKLLVVDNSSVMWEACALGIPVVVLNAPWYRRDVNFGLRFWGKSDIGPHVEQPNELAAAIELVLTADRWQLRRQRAAEYVYGDIAGATARARERVTEWAL